MNWSYRKNIILQTTANYCKLTATSGCVGPVQIPLDELADELNDYEARIAELEADNNRLKCSNDTQTDTVVYGKDSD